MNWRSVLSLSRSPSNTSASALEALLETYKGVFEQRLGTMTVFQAELKLKKRGGTKILSSTTGAFCIEGACREGDTSPRGVGYARKSVTAPIVVAPKKDGRIASAVTIK